MMDTWPRRLAFGLVAMAAGIVAGGAYLAAQSYATSEINSARAFACGYEAGMTKAARVMRVDESKLPEMTAACEAIERRATSHGLYLP